MKYYPIMLKLDNVRVTIIGGGRVAVRKLKDILEAGAFVTLIAPDLDDHLKAYQTEYPGSITYLNRTYKEGDLQDTQLVFCATNDQEVNERVYREATQKNIFINAVDDVPHCSFIVPSSFSRGKLIIAVSTSGGAPALAAKLRRDIEDTIPENIADTIEKVARVRQILHHDPEFEHLSQPERALLCKKIIVTNFLDQPCSLDTDIKIKDYLRRLLDVSQRSEK